MPTEYKILAGVFALALSHDIGRRSANKKLKKKLSESVDVSIMLWKTTLELHGEVSYLMNEVINPRDITLDEFDLIALPHVNVK
jgi:hypothetical protein